MFGTLPQKMKDLSLLHWFLFSLQAIVTTDKDIQYFWHVISLLICHLLHEHDGGRPISCLYEFRTVLFKPTRLLQTYLQTCEVAIVIFFYLYAEVITYVYVLKVWNLFSILQGCVIDKWAADHRGFARPIPKDLQMYLLQNDCIKRLAHILLGERNF